MRPPGFREYVDASVACSALDTEKDLGWRVKEVTMYKDTECQEPLLDGGNA